MSLQERLKKLSPFSDYPESEKEKEDLATTAQQIEKDLLELLPNKIKLDTAVYENYGDGNTEERIGYKHGFNDCLDELRQIIKKYCKG